MKQVALAAIMIVLSIYGSAQTAFIQWNEHRPLTWADFTGTEDASSMFDAESSSEITYSYTFNSLSEYTFDVKAKFLKNRSWYRQKAITPALLQHEQVHFDIAQLYATRLKQALESYRYTDNFKQEIEQVAERYKSEYQLMQKLYDEETNHSTVAAKQRQWESLIRQEINLAKQQSAYPNSANNTTALTVNN